MPVAGLVRLRRHLFGRQTAFGNPEPATRAYPFSGVPSVNLNWTETEGDFGSLDPVAAPTRGIPDLSASLTSPVLNYNDLPLMLGATFGGGVTPTGGGTAKTWDYPIASLTADDVDVFSYEFGDDVQTDWFQLTDGIVTDLTINSPEEGAGKLDASMTWKFAEAASTGSTDSPVSGTVPFDDAVPDVAAIPVYLQDAKVYIDSAAGSLGSTQLTDAVHNFSLHVSQEVDEKRYVNGTQSFKAQNYGRGARSIEMTLQFAKMADTVGTGSESDAWFSDTSVNRFLKIVFTSTELAQAATPYKWTLTMPMRYFTREETSIGQNTTVTLVAHAFYEPATLMYAIDTTVINTLAIASYES